MEQLNYASKNHITNGQNKLMKEIPQVIHQLTWRIQVNPRILKGEATVTLLHMLETILFKENLAIFDHHRQIYQETRIITL